MFRLSDVLGGKGTPEEPEQPAGTKPAAPEPSAESAPPPPKLRPETARALTNLEALYDKLLACVKKLFAQARTDQPLTLSEARTLVAQLPQVKEERCEVILMLVGRHSDENYLYSHSVNVALLANHLGHCLGHAGEPLTQLALAALAHDIGMAGEAEQVAEAPRKLTQEEWKTITQHPQESVKRLKDAQQLSQEALQAVASHHEREGGQGYPAGAQTSALNEFAKILAVCDVYDAMTHPRSHRKRYSPAQAIKVLIDGVGDVFDRRVVKALVDDLSLYPRGSRVRLNTNEIGVVETVHPGAPLRPVILVSHDATNTPLVEPRRVNLLDQPFIYVKEIVTDEDTPATSS